MAVALSAREEAILLGLLDNFIKTREPVPSKLLSEQNPEGLSSATVRAILNHLEDLGYLHQPHASAGRVPTDEAYRYLARWVQQVQSAEVEPDWSELERLTREGSLDGVAREICNSLSRSVHGLGIAVTPSLEEIRLRSCELVAVGPERILLVVVSQAGQVHQTVLHSPERYTPEQLRWFSGYLGDTYAGWSFTEIRENLRAQVEGESAACSEGVARAFRLVAPYFMAYPARRELFWDGAAWLLQSPELRRNLDGVRILLESLEQKFRLLDLLDALARNGEPLQVVLGDDWPDPGVQELALVAAPYGGEGSGYGVVGVIGPKSLSYREAIWSVRRAARLATLASTRL